MSRPNPWAANALFAGPLIVAQLKALVPDLREVMEIDEFDPKLTKPRQLPAAVVVLHALRPTSPNPMRRVVTMAQDWLVLLAANSLRPADNRNSSEFGRLIPKVVAALQGWAPPGTDLALSWDVGPRPNYGTDVSYFPLRFTLQAVSTASA